MTKPSPEERAKKLSEGLEFVKDLPGFERGHPHYFKDPIIDHLLEIVLQLGAEIWITRDRQMVTEYLLATEGKVTPEMIESFKPPAEWREKMREERRNFTRRLYQCLYEGIAPPGDANFNSGVLRREG
ncbi:MAG: hypothetical protein JNK21_03175 [Rhodospirillaceae bacterium]|nr:hypothetical protein [Rhodospirillaceae bacterium]